MHYIQGVASPSGAYLVSNLVTGNSQTVDASTSGWTLGRDPRQSHLAVLDRQLSRCHARLQYLHEAGFVLSDEGSTNGTFVNGAALESPQSLRDGDQIRVGSLTIFFFTCAAGPVPQATDDASEKVLEPSGITTLPGHVAAP